MQADSLELKSILLYEEIVKDPTVTDIQVLEKLERFHELRGNAEEGRKNWGAGGKYRQIANALQVALTGNVANIGVHLVRNMTISYLQQNISKKIGEMVSFHKNNSLKMELKSELTNLCYIFI